MKITILTMFPQLFDSFREGPVVQRAIRKGSLELSVVDIKEFAPGSFRHIDDSPFGGGAGMVMRCQPVLDALRSVRGSAESGSGGSDERENGKWHNCCCIVTGRPSVYTEAGTPLVGA